MKQNHSEIYRLLLSSIIPRPVAFVSSFSADDVPNLAPFRYVPTVALGIWRNDAYPPFQLLLHGMSLSIISDLGRLEYRI